MIPPPPPAEGEAPGKPVEVKETVEQLMIFTPDYTKKGYHLDVKVTPQDLPAIAQILIKHKFFIESITGVDWIKEQQIEVVYDFNLWEELCRVVIRTRTDRSTPEVPTISEIYHGANWHERETHDFFGVNFTGHPDLSPLLLVDDADFHPLLKDFKA
ncbi:MAG: NADH-quinone oxidoreductase subunit C [Proteobacteria bacterium]|nr:NADH-quinone oxidoreductase subunit C [Desulfobulbaceae bacterium]MBU4151984.1 NADH-quinone oxidoreductase subunit C [Pseudomonadota bacterium]